VRSQLKYITIKQFAAACQVLLSKKTPQAIKSQVHYSKKKTFTAAFRYYCPWNHIINKLSLETSHHETNLKHENFIASPDIIYSYTLVAMVQNHFTTSTSWCLQNLRTVGMVD